MISHKLNKRAVKKRIDTVEKKMADAKVLMDKKNYQKAIQRLKELANIEYTAEALMLLGDCYSYLADEVDGNIVPHEAYYLESKSHYYKALQLIHNERVHLAINEAEALIKKNAYQDAVDTLYTVSNWHTYSKIILLIGKCQYASCQYVEAIDTYEAGLEQFPNNTNFIYPLARCYYELQMYEEVIIYLKKDVEWYLNEKSISLIINCQKHIGRNFDDLTKMLDDLDAKCRPQSILIKAEEIDLTSKPRGVKKTTFSIFDDAKVPQEINAERNVKVPNNSGPVVKLSADNARVGGMLQSTDQEAYIPPYNPNIRRIKNPSRIKQLANEHGRAQVNINESVPITFEKSNREPHELSQDGREKHEIKSSALIFSNNLKPRSRSDERYISYNPEVDSVHALFKSTLKIDAYEAFLILAYVFSGFNEAFEKYLNDSVNLKNSIQKFISQQTCYSDNVPYLISISLLPAVLVKVSRTDSDSDEIEQYIAVRDALFITLKKRYPSLLVEEELIKSKSLELYLQHLHYSSALQFHKPESTLAESQSKYSEPYGEQFINFLNISDAIRKNPSTIFELINKANQPNQYPLKKLCRMAIFELKHFLRPIDGMNLINRMFLHERAVNNFNSCLSFGLLPRVFPFLQKDLKTLFNANPFLLKYVCENLSTYKYLGRMNAEQQLKYLTLFILIGVYQRMTAPICEANSKQAYYNYIDDILSECQKIAPYNELLTTFNGKSFVKDGVRAHYYHINQRYAEVAINIIELEKKPASFKLLRKN